MDVRNLLMCMPLEKHRSQRRNEKMEQLRETVKEIQKKLPRLSDELQKESVEELSCTIQRAQKILEEFLKDYGKSKGRADRNWAEKSIGEINDRLQEMNKSLDNPGNEVDCKRAIQNLQEINDKIDLRNMSEELVKVYSPIFDQLKNDNRLRKDMGEFKQSLDNPSKGLKMFLDKKWLYTACNIIEELASKNKKFLNYLKSYKFIDKNTNTEDIDKGIKDRLENIKRRYRDYDRETLGADTRGNKEPNEDAFFASNKHGVHAVFDGVTGKRGGSGGHIASAIAVDYLRQSLPLLSEDYLRQSLPRLSGVEKIKQEMSSILKGLNAEIVEHRQGGYSAMATTASIVKVMKDGTAVIGNVGDSRVYLLRSGKSSVKHLTLDDNALLDAVKLVEGNPWEMQKRLADADDYRALAADLIAEEVDPKLNPDLRDSFGLGERQLAEVWPMITKNLGSLEDSEPNIYACKLNPGDMLIITSDGVHDNLTDADIADCILANKNNSKGAANALIQESEYISTQGLSRSKPDDITAIVIKYPGEGRNNAQASDKRKAKVGESLEKNGSQKRSWRTGASTSSNNPF